MKHPASLNATRARALLPTNTRKGLVWPEITQDEALYIKHLDEVQTFSELSSYLVGIASASMGMLLVRAAERKVGDRVPRVKTITLTGLSRHEEEEEDEEDEDERRTA